MHPVHRMLTSNKFFQGCFFDKNGAPQIRDCVLISFPKAGRGNTRLQVKAWYTDVQEISSGASKAPHPDTKAQFLSYIGWIYGVSETAPCDLGKFPLDVEGGITGCQYCRTRVGLFKSDQLLCINPFHYVPFGKHAALRSRIGREMKTCFKDRDVLPGETPAGAIPGANASGGASKSRCYCIKCRKLEVEQIDKPSR